MSTCLGYKLYTLAVTLAWGAWVPTQEWALAQDTTVAIICNTIQSPQCNPLQGTDFSLHGLIIKVFTQELDSTNPDSDLDWGYDYYSRVAY